jgi:hypothetical protein
VESLAVFAIGMILPGERSSGKEFESVNVA